MFGPYAGGTNITVITTCPSSGCGDVTLTIGDKECDKLQEKTSVRFEYNSD